MSPDPSNDGFHSKTAAFMTWLLQRPGTKVSPKIQIADFRDGNAGRGIVATADIREDEELFSISQSDVLTVENSSIQEAIPGILDHLDAWNSLILVMIYEDGQGQQSKWWPYLQILPTRFDTLIYWSPCELAELEGSAVLDKIGKDGADSSFKKILLPIVQQNPELFGRHSQAFHGPSAEATLLDLAHRMATLIMAYGFDLEAESPSSDDEDDMDGSSQAAYELNKGMVPLADLFNADGNLNNAHLLQQEVSMTMIAIKDIASGQQIYNDFGQLPRSDLLRRYGYITDNYKKWDVVEVDIGTITQAAGEVNKLGGEKEKRLELAVAWGVLQDGYDLSRPPEGEVFEFDQALVLTITALLLDTEQFEQGLEEPPEHPPPSMQRTLGFVLKKVVSSRQSSYKTTIAEDYAILDDPTVHGRRRMAIEVRLGEKEILAMAADEIDKCFAKFDQGADEEASGTFPKRERFDD